MQVYSQQKELFREVKKVAKPLKKMTGALDIQLGHKYVRYKPTKELCIRIIMPEKKPLSTLLKREQLPSHIAGIATDVIVHKVNLQADTSIISGHRKLAGISIQSNLVNNEIRQGTMGHVLDIGGFHYGLTCFHLIFGTTPDDSQALSYCGADIRAISGVLKGKVIGRVCDIYNKQLDYCLISLSVLAGVMPDTGHVDLVAGYMHPAIGVKVFRNGIATEKTDGIIEAWSCLNKATVIIRGQSTTSRQISDCGDSGSVWMGGSLNPAVKESRIVALHIGGDKQANVAYAKSFCAIYASINKRFNL